MIAAISCIPSSSLVVGHLFLYFVEKERKGRKEEREGRKKERKKGKEGSLSRYSIV